MATIKQLSEADIVENGDQFPFFSEAQGDTRKVTFATLKDSVATDFVSAADLAAQTGATLVGCNGGTTVQQELDAKVSATLDTDGTLAANSDARVASQKATKTYADTKVATASLAASSGSSLVGHIATGAGATARTVQGKLRDVINVADWGIVGDGGTDNTAALTSLRAYAATRSFAGNTIKIIWPQGRYVYSASPNWAIIGLEMEFQGEVWLINTGTGNSFILDGGATGPGVYGVKITGFPRIFGESGSSNGIYCRSIYRSHIEVNVRGAGSAFSGGRFEWCVSNNIWFIMNFNEGGLYSVPARGITVTSRSSDTLESGWNNFWNIETSGIPIGVLIDGALGTKFFGGAIQGNTDGAQVTVNAQGTVFYGTDFEANSSNDVEDAGNCTQFIGCDFDDGPRFITGALGGKIIGGNMKNIYIDSGAKDCLISGCDFNWQYVPGVGAITDNGTRTRFRDVRNAGTDELYDKPRAREAIAVGPSPFTYTNNSGNDEIILVYGGTVSLLALSRFAGDPMPVTGQYTLRPRDSIYIEYTSAPAMVRWT